MVLPRRQRAVKSLTDQNAAPLLLLLVPGRRAGSTSKEEGNLSRRRLLQLLRRALPEGQRIDLPQAIMLAIPVVAVEYLRPLKPAVVAVLSFLPLRRRFRYGLLGRQRQRSDPRGFQVEKLLDR